MKISIIHPSRCRPEQAHARYLEWTTLCGVNYEYILSVDEDDPTLGRYQELFGADLTIGRNRSMIDAANRGGKDSTGDILVLVSDDFRCFKDWGRVIVEAVKGRENWVLKTADGLQPWIVTLPIMDRAYYNSFGYVYYPGYKHLFCDTELTHVADLTGRLIIRNDIVFPHENETYHGRGGDAINFRNNQSFRQGERLYRKRLAQRFGLGTKVDPYKLAPEAYGHLCWISPRFRKKRP